MKQKIKKLTLVSHHYEPNSVMMNWNQNEGGGLSYQQGLERIRESQGRHSMYRPGLPGLVRIENDEVIYRDVFFKALPAKAALRQADLDALDWRIATIAD